jgi:anti-anti-sigma factor
VVNVEVAGRLDGYWADHLNATLTDVVREGHHRIRLDCAKVTFLSSAGIVVLLRFFKELKAINGVFRVVNPSPIVVSVLRMTQLVEMLIETGEVPESVVPATRPVQHRDRDGLALEIFELDAKARLTCRSLGSPDRLAPGAASVGSACESLESLSLAVAVGVGAFGESFDDCRGRFGEMLSVAGTTVYQPADGTNVADYMLSEGQLGSEVRALYCLACEGQFSHLVRFEAGHPDAPIGLETLVTACLEEAAASAIGFVMVAETAGLVGAALRQSPAASGGGQDFFAFPGIRNRLAFTAERAFPRSVALVGGVVSRASDGSSQPQFRPLGAEVSGHVHAAAFRFQPVRKGFVDLGPTITGLFDADRLLGVLHLLNDDRGAAGAGESEFIRGACWIGRID